MPERNEDARIYTMAQEEPMRAVWKMGIPVTVGLLFMAAYNLVDTYFIGLLHDDAQLAAANLAYPIMMVLIAAAGIVGNGGASYIARCIGAGDMEEANRTLWTGLELTVLGSLGLTAGGIFFLQPILTLLGAEGDTVFYTGQYVFVLFAGSVFIMGNYAVGQLLRSEGSIRYSMIGMLAGTLANLLLDPLFIFTFHLGIRGAAIATVLGNALGLAIFVYCYAAKKSLLRPTLHIAGLEGRIVKEIMWVGIPHTLEQLFTTAAMVVNNNLAAGYGTATVAAMGISMKLMSVGSYIYQGFAAGCQPLMGYNFGAKNYVRLKKLIQAGILVITLVECGILAICGVFAPALAGLFSESGAVTAIAARTLRAAMLMLPFVGTTVMVRNAYNSIGMPQYSFGITVIRQLFLYIPLLLLFNRWWGYTGLIYAQPVEEFICMAVAAWILSRTIRRLQTETDGQEKGTHGREKLLDS